MKRAALLLFFCVVALPASGVLYVYEGFDYPAGTDNLSGQNGGTGFTAAWTLTGGAGNPNVAAGTMGYSDLAGRILLTSGNRAYFDATNTDVVTAGTSSIAFRDMNLTLALGGTLYFSLMGDQLTGDGRATNFAFFAGGTEAVSVGHGTNTPVGGPFRWGAFTAGNGNNGAYSNVSILDASFLVLRIDLNVDVSGNDRVRLYVNPMLDAEPAVADVDFSDRNVTTAFSALTRIRPFAGNSNGTFVASQADYDELRIGDTWSDVTPNIPEPTTGMALATCTSLLHACRRRRKTAGAPR